MHSDPVRLKGCTLTMLAKPIASMLAAATLVAAFVVSAGTVTATSASAGAFTPALAATVTTPKWVAPDVAPYTSTAPVKQASTVSVSGRVAVSSKSASSKRALARQLLARQIRKYPILKGTTVEFGDAKGYQAVCYYKSGRIVVSKSHKATLKKIITHEVWHVIDWRDNGRIDWGEKVPRS